MLKHTLICTPRDLLFFRDAREMSGGWIGRGAAWPLPSIFHEALHTAFLDRWPQAQAWETLAPEGRSRKRSFISSSKRFGALRSAGPFPFDAKTNTLYLPTPSDLLPDGEIGYAPSLEPAGKSNLPRWLLPVVRLAKADKEKPGEWLALDQYGNYLRGEKAVAVRIESLYLREQRIGIAIDPATHSTEKGKFYAAEYLRLRSSTALLAFAEHSLTKKKEATDNGADAVAEWINPPTENLLQLGGQRGCVSCESIKIALDPLAPKKAGKRVKWTLLSPAIFAHGWLPGWAGPPTGKNIAADEAQADGTLRFPGLESCRLKAALIPKPIHFSGWSAADGRPKPTRLAVPAGAVYYFECNNEESAELLIERLHLSPRSDFLGEKGFGLGVCGSWNYAGE